MNNKRVKTPNNFGGLEGKQGEEVASSNEHLRDHSMTQVDLAKIKELVDTLWDGTADAKRRVGEADSMKATLHINKFEELVEGHEAISIGIVDFSESRSLPKKYGFRLILTEDLRLVAASFKSKKRNSDGTPNFSGPLIRLHNAEPILIEWLEYFREHGIEMSINAATGMTQRPR